MEVVVAEFDVLRHNAESRMRMGTGAPEAFASVLRMQGASLAMSEGYPVLASNQRDVNFPTAAYQMRRLFGPRGGAAREDVCVAADMNWPSGTESDRASRLAHRKAKKEIREEGERRGKKRQK